MDPPGELDELHRRRLLRLRDELHDERVPVPLDGLLGWRLVEEVDYARFPRVHEQRVPTYGALLFDRPPEAASTGSQQARIVPMHELSLSWIRRFADGRGAFLIRFGASDRLLACFEHSVEYEANLVELVRNTGAHVVQRTARGHVKVFTPSVVIVWDGTRWLQKPHADRFRELVLRLVQDCDNEVLDGLLEVSVHWLSPAFLGAVFVWSLHRPALELRGVDIPPTHTQPQLSVTSRAHYPALFSVHGQLDGATLVDPAGRCRAYGATLNSSAEATSIVPADRGTRHTSARRYSYDHPGTTLFVVSEDGPVSVYVDGARIAVVRTDPSRMPRDDDPRSERRHENLVRCPSCHRTLLVDLPRDGRDETRRLHCPVCEQPAGRVPAKTRTRGVRTTVGARHADEAESAPDSAAGRPDFEPRPPPDTPV